MNATPLVTRGLQRLAGAASQPFSPGILEEEPCGHGPGSNHVPCAQESAPAQRHRGGASPAATRGHRCFRSERIGHSGAQRALKASWGLMGSHEEWDALAGLMSVMATIHMVSCRHASRQLSRSIAVGSRGRAVGRHGQRTGQDVQCRGVSGRACEGLFRARMKCRGAWPGVGVQVAPSVSAVAPAHPCPRRFALARPLYIEIHSHLGAPVVPSYTRLLSTPAQHHTYTHTVHTHRLHTVPTCIRDDCNDAGIPSVRHLPT